MTTDTVQASARRHSAERFRKTGDCLTAAVHGRVVAARCAALVWSRLTWLLCITVGLAVGIAPVRADEPIEGSDYPTTFAAPDRDSPTEVLLNFQLYDVNNIDSVTETFEFTGLITLTWNDPRQAFDPDVVGVPEKLYQGDYQFNEIATGWYPQVVLLNDAGAYEKLGVQLRIRPDGTSVLTEMIRAVAESKLDMRSFPFDEHRLEAAFALLGQGDDAILEINPEGSGTSGSVRIAGWNWAGMELAAQRPAEDVARATQNVVLTLAVSRNASYLRRLITFPMVVIVLLSFSIFWMDKSSIGDRNSISLLGVLTGVAFQHTIVSVIPPVSYITLMQAFLFVSFLLMAATVPVNLLVASMDKKGRSDLGDLVDQRCRWLFPLVYLGLMGLIAWRALS